MRSLLASIPVVVALACGGQVEPLPEADAELTPNTCVPVESDSACLDSFGAALGSGLICAHAPAPECEAVGGEDPNRGEVWCCPAPVCVRDVSQVGSVWACHPATRPDGDCSFYGKRWHCA